MILERETDGGFVASVPVLPGCISQGDSRDEAIDLYIEDCLLAGDPVPQEDSREYVELLTGYLLINAARPRNEMISFSSARRVAT